MLNEQTKHTEAMSARYRALRIFARDRENNFGAKPRTPNSWNLFSSLTIFSSVPFPFLFSQRITFHLHGFDSKVCSQPQMLCRSGHFSWRGVHAERRRSPPCSPVTTLKKSYETKGFHLQCYGLNPLYLRTSKKPFEKTTIGWSSHPQKVPEVYFDPEAFQQPPNWLHLRLDLQERSSTRKPPEQVHDSRMMIQNF